jgi:alkylated DNA repair dioxygenase AlkB
MNRIIDTGKSFLDVYTMDDYNELMSLCIEEIQDGLIVNPKIKIFGKDAIQHRSVGFFSDTSGGYYFSGQLAESSPLTPNLAVLLEKINMLFKSDFTGILVNKYNDGLDYIGAHSDKTQHLDNSHGVVAISYGAVRKFRIKNKITKEKVVDVPTLPNSIIHMGGDFQKEFTHEIPIEKKIKDVRYSLTFRKHLV